MELAGIIIAALSLLATAVTYIADKFLERKQRTLEKLNELRNAYHDSVAGKERKHEKDYYRSCVKLFGNVDQFCAGVLSRYYSIGAVKKNGSRFISMLFSDFKEYLIDQRRRMYPDENYYQNLEKLVNKLKKVKYKRDYQNNPKKRTN